jgi:beta-xylosidase
MRWVDGWPAIGSPPGRPVPSFAKPAGSGAPGAPSAGDDFTGPDLGAQWTWAGNPRPGWSSLLPGGGLRLACVPPGADGDLRRLPSVLGQRLPADRFRAATTLRLAGTTPGARAGLTILGHSYAWIGVEHAADGLTLVHRAAERGEPERDAAPPVIVGDSAVAVGVEVTPDGRCQFLAGEPPKPVGPRFAATAGHWVGATLGLFATGTSGAADITALGVTA